MAKSTDNSSQLHEDFRRSHSVKESSNRSFGFVFAVVFAIIGLFPLISDQEPRYWSLAIACAFLLLGLLSPSTLEPLNRLWLRFGALLHKVVNPIILFLMYSIAIVPIGIIMRLLRKDLLQLSWKPDAPTYWSTRDPTPSPRGMRNQF